MNLTKSNMSLYFVLPVVVSVLALLFLDPFQVLMPTGGTTLLLGGLMVSTMAYGVLIFLQQVHDEREQSIRAFADRWACLIGMTLLVMSIGYRIMVDGHVYPEIILILVTMIISKSASHWYASTHY
jgi:hypothetical protein